MTASRDPRWKTVFDAVVAAEDTADAAGLTRPSRHALTAKIIDALRDAEHHAFASEVRPPPPLLTWRDLGLEPPGPAADAVRIVDVYVAPFHDGSTQKLVQLRARRVDGLAGEYDVHGPGNAGPGMDDPDAAVGHLGVAVRTARKILAADDEADRAMVTAQNVAREKRLAAAKTAADEVFAEIDRGDRR